MRSCRNTKAVKEKKTLVKQVCIFPTRGKKCQCKRVQTAKQKTKKAIMSLKEGTDNAKSKWGTDKDIMDEKEQIKAPNVYLWARYHFSL